MKIMILCSMDSSGNMYSLARNINKYSKHNASMIKLKEHQDLKYPTMFLWDEDDPIQRTRIEEADVIIVKEFWWIPEKMGVVNELYDKTVVALFGGGGYRWDKNRVENMNFFEALPDVRYATSSINFLEDQSEWAWIPASVRYGELREKYCWHDKWVPPLVVSSPSRDTDIRKQQFKNFLEVVHHLKRNGHKFQAAFLRDYDNDTCLRMKSPASIFFDRLYDIYGINSQEAGAFESVVITGSSDYTLNALREMGFPCPFVIVENYRQVARAMSDYLKHPEHLYSKALQCRDYVEKLHSGEEAVKRLMEVL